jgi:hypothetical protein
MAASFSSAMWRFASTGFQRVSAEDHERRMKVCRDCDQFQGSRCLACGCFPNTKAWLPRESCVLGKWPNVSDAPG